MISELFGLCCLIIKHFTIPGRHVIGRARYFYGNNQIGRKMGLKKKPYYKITFISNPDCLIILVLHQDICPHSAQHAVSLLYSVLYRQSMCSSLCYSHCVFISMMDRLFGIMGGEKHAHNSQWSLNQGLWRRHCVVGGNIWNLTVPIIYIQSWLSAHLAVWVWTQFSIWIKWQGMCV